MYQNVTTRSYRKGSLAYEVVSFGARHNLRWCDNQPANQSIDSTRDLLRRIHRRWKTHGDGWNGNILYIGEFTPLSMTGLAMRRRPYAFHQVYTRLTVVGGMGLWVSWSVGGLSGGADDTCSGTAGNFTVTTLAPTLAPTFTPAPTSSPYRRLYQQQQAPTTSPSYIPIRPFDGRGSVVRNSTSAEAMYGHISKWDTSAVTDMSWDSVLLLDEHIQRENIGSWDTSCLANDYALCSGASAFDQNIGNWDTSSVTDMYGCSRASAFGQNIGYWNTSSVTICQDSRRIHI